MRTPTILALAALLVALAPQRSAADGFIIVDRPIDILPHPRPPHHHWHPRPIQRFMPLEVREHHVTVDIRGGVATTAVDQTFYNPSGQRLEGTYIFPIPNGAEIDKFEMDVNGTMTSAELLDADKARGIYEEIVRKAKDPALMEYSGRGMFKVRIFPIEPRSEKRVKIKYTQVLKRDGRITGYLYPLNTEKFSSRPVKSISLKATIESKGALKSIYSPTHDVEVSRKGDHRAVVGFEQSDSLPNIDFNLFFAADPAEGSSVGLELLTYRDPKAKEGADGYYMMLLSPGAWEGQKTVPKDVVFAVDTSGSMRVKKLDQAKAALGFCIDSLNKHDRFDIVRYSTEAETLFDGLRPANKANITEAQEFIDGLRAGGGTAIGEALLMSVGHATSAQQQRDPSRPYQIIFLTDGRPTIGETRPEKIVGRLGEALKDIAGTVRVFSFGIGTDINTKLLGQIADNTRATTEYVLPEEDIELKVSRFYAKIAEPVMTGLKIKTTGGVRLSERHPNNLPDLFKGDQLVLFGRYAPSKKTRDKGEPSIVLEGSMAGEQRRFEFASEFAKKAKDHEFIPRLWATRRVGYLLDQIRLGGEKKELKDEVVVLARRWGIVTPYTSYLIIEDEEVRGVPLAQQTMGRRAHANFAGRGGGGRDFFGADGTTPLAPAALDKKAREVERAAYDLFADADTGDAAVAGARSSSKLKAATVTDAPTKAYLESQYAAGEYRFAQQPTQVVAGKTFYLNGSQWTDSEVPDLAKDDKAITTIEFGSDAYFALLAKSPQIARWLSIGNDLQLVIEDKIYQIVSNKSE